MRVLVALAVTLCLPAGGRDLVHAHAGLDEVDRVTREEVRRHPERPDVHLNRARVHQMAHEWDEAVAELEEAAAHGADADVVGTMKGEVYLAAGWPRMAKRELDRVLARRPDAFGALFERGRAWLALGDAEAAAKDMGAAIAGLAEPRPEQVIARHDVLVSLGKKAEAVTALDEGMARIGRVPSLALPAVTLEVELERYDSALARLDALIARGPVVPSWIARRGEVLEAAGRVAEAREEYARALAALDQRPAGRGGARFDDLRRRLEQVLGPRVAQQGGNSR